MTNKQKLRGFVFILGIFSLAACNSNTKSNEDKIIDEIEVIESEIDDASEQLDAEIDDMNHDVDSLLEGI
jgi:hypothetical protein